MIGVPFQPGARSKARALLAFEPGVPTHLTDALWEWVSAFLDDDTIRMVNVEFRLGLPAIDWTNHDRLTEVLRRMAHSNPDFHLELVEYLVPRAAERDQRELEVLLAAVPSAYAVVEDELTTRVDPVVQAQVESAVTEAQDGPAHWLTEAWNDAYALKPRPGPAYDASIRAVEAALRDIVIPKNGRATITQIINALRDGRRNFVFELQDSRGGAVGANEPEVDAIDSVLAMLRALAYGQKTRHGDSGAVTINSAEEARAAVQFAVTLVQLGTSGALRRR